MTKTILVVEDDASLRRFYQRALSQQGYILTLASGTGEARALLGLSSSDLLITDMELGDGLGTDLIELACTGTDCKTKAILVTGSLQEPELREVAVKYSLPAYFGKPFSIDALLTTVKDVLALP